MEHTTIVPRSTADEIIEPEHTPDSVTYIIAFAHVLRVVASWRIRVQIETQENRAHEADAYKTYESKYNAVYQSIGRGSQDFNDALT